MLNLPHENNSLFNLKKSYNKNICKVRHLFYIKNIHKITYNEYTYQPLNSYTIQQHHSLGISISTTLIIQQMLVREKSPEKDTI